jgi:hypothetical protein
MGRTFKAGACVLALGCLVASQADAKHALRATSCADPSEVTAIAAASIQQQLMVAALTCNQVDNFNAFQTNFGPELRASDRRLMQMFLRLYGGGRGTAEYHLFKTRLANNSEIRSIHGNQDYCAAATLVFQAALAPAKPTLNDFVSGVQVSDPSPVDSCQMQVTAGLQGAMVDTTITPRRKPAQFEDVALEVPAPPPTTPASLTPAASPATTAPAEKKKSSWLSGIFN